MPSSRMPTGDLLVSSFVHLPNFPRANEALQALKKIASLVKPIMRARNFKVRELAEFYPSQSNLLGLNVNKGQKICLRLRHPGDPSQFMPFESVVDTMLHELCHNVHGPHNQHFHALWDQLRDELQGLMMKGYTGEGFLSTGHRLGGSRMPQAEINRLARKEADRRRGQQQRPGPMMPGHRLGGRPPMPGEDIRRIIVGAVERRNRTLQGCGTERMSDREIVDLADSATRNGFRTQAEEDEANEAAIAQALWELVQEDEKAKYGSGYIPPSAENPTGNGGGAVVGKEQPTGGIQTTLTNSSWEAPPPTPARADVSTVEDPFGWACDTCTLQNPSHYLCCDACGSERPIKPPPRPPAISNSGPGRPTPPPPPPSASRPPPKSASSSRPRTVEIDLTADSPPKQRKKTAAATATATATEPSKKQPVAPQMWNCSFCNTRMDRQWWTCSTCGKMKDSSR